MSLEETERQSIAKARHCAGSCRPTSFETSDLLPRVQFWLDVSDETIEAWVWRYFKSIEMRVVTWDSTRPGTGSDRYGSLEDLLFEFSGNERMVVVVLHWEQHRKNLGSTNEEPSSPTSSTKVESDLLCTLIKLSHQHPSNDAKYVYLPSRKLYKAFNRLPYFIGILGASDSPCGTPKSQKAKEDLFEHEIRLPTTADISPDSSRERETFGCQDIPSPTRPTLCTETIGASFNGTST